MEDHAGSLMGRGERMDFDDATEEVILAASALRMTLAPYAEEWRERHGLPVDVGQAVTTNLCRGAAYGLLMHLREEIPDARWWVDGGYGAEAVSLHMPDGTSRTDLPRIIHTERWPGGMQAPDGTWRGHFWVCGRLADGLEIVVDLTADQFGYADLVVEPASDPRYRSNLRTDIVEYGFTVQEMGWGCGLHSRYWQDKPAAGPAPR